jgi:phosphatidate phosphatase PAH1
LYLSSRSISHAYATRGYLKVCFIFSAHDVCDTAVEFQGVRQEKTASLPDGPVLLSPESFMNSIHREVIARTADEFKIPCLLSVLELFPLPDSTTGPFVAGFGNRNTDVVRVLCGKVCRLN